MAEVKITELPTATTPAGTEPLPIVQGGTTKKITIANISPGITGLTAAQGGTGAATLTDHGVLLGSGTGAVTPTAVGSNGQIFTGATAADPGWQTMSGDVTYGTTGVTAIGASKVTAAMIASAILDGSKAAVVPDASVVGGQMLVFPINIANGADASNVDVTVTNKIRVVRIDIVKTGGVGIMGDTVVVKNSTNAISNTLSLLATNPGDFQSANTLSPTYYEIAAAGTLRVTRGSAAGLGNNACLVTVYAYRIT